MMGYFRHSLTRVKYSSDSRIYVSEGRTTHISSVCTGLRMQRNVTHIRAAPEVAHFCHG